MAGRGIVDRVTGWADGRPDIVCLVQIGSSVQAHGRPDRWSDTDFQLITRRPAVYRRRAFAEEIGPVATFMAQAAFGGVTKSTAVLKTGEELDFAVLPAGGLRVAFAALRFRGTESLWPAPLRRGVRDLRVVAGAGWKVLKGGPAWERRYRRLAPVSWPPELTEEEYRRTCEAFWTALVWICRRIRRGEWLAARREYHRTLLEAFLRLAESEAQAAGRAARPEARRAEEWMDPGSYQEAAIEPAASAESLTRAVQRLSDRFAALSAQVAQRRGFSAPLTAAEALELRAYHLTS